MDGIENIRVDTMHGVLQYQRPGADKKVRWCPPSALRRIDLILIDEASQFEDLEWMRFYQCMRSVCKVDIQVVIPPFLPIPPYKPDGSPPPNACVPHGTAPNVHFPLSLACHYIFPTRECIPLPCILLFSTVPPLACNHILPTRECPIPLPSLSPVIARAYEVDVMYLRATTQALYCGCC